MNAWATGKVDLGYWNQSFLKTYTVVAISNGDIVGFGNIETHSSITARSFFESRGYKVVKEQQEERAGVVLTNFIMEK